MNIGQKKVTKTNSDKHKMKKMKWHKPKSTKSWKN